MVVNTWLFLEHDFLNKSPSRKLLTISQELRTRKSIQDFLIKLGTSLKVDSHTIFAATLYVNRFYMRLPITTSKYFVASAAIAISCKLNDTYRQPDKIALASSKIRNPGKAITENSDTFWQWRDQLLYREELILKNLNFELNLRFPYEIRDHLMTVQIPDGQFKDSREDFLKNTVSLIELISSLPVLVAYDIETVFGALLVLVVLEGNERFNIDAHVPKNFIQDNLMVSIPLCWQCYNYVTELLKYCNDKDPSHVFHGQAIKRLKVRPEAVYFAAAGE